MRKLLLSLGCIVLCMNFNIQTLKSQCSSVGNITSVRATRIHGSCSKASYNFRVTGLSDDTQAWFFTDASRSSDAILKISSSSDIGLKDTFCLEQGGFWYVYGYDPNIDCFSRFGLPVSVAVSRSAEAPSNISVPNIACTDQPIQLCGDIVSGSTIKWYDDPYGTGTPLAESSTSIGGQVCASYTPATAGIFTLYYQGF